MPTRTKLPVPTSPHGLIIESHQFHLGFRQALTNSPPLTRFDMLGDPSEKGIIEIVRNMAEMYKDDELSEAQLQHDCGLIAGWVYRLAVRVEV